MFSTTQQLTRAGVCVCMCVSLYNKHWILNTGLASLFRLVDKSGRNWKKLQNVHKISFNSFEMNLNTI